jgi:hypothetical protein
VLAVNSKKEALLRALKNRIPLVNIAIKNQYPWDKIMDTAVSVVTPPQLQSLTVDASNMVTLGISVGSLEEIHEIINKTEQLSEAKRIRNSHIRSLESDKKGVINAVIQFTPIF